MCSAPKGVSGKARPSSKVKSLFDGMDAAEYSDFVQQTNESYELRQHELAVLRAADTTGRTIFAAMKLPGPRPGQPCMH